MTYTSILQISDRLFQCPRSWLSGESGGSGRPNNNGVVGQCDPLAERDL